MSKKVRPIPGDEYETATPPPALIEDIEALGVESDPVPAEPVVENLPATVEETPIEQTPVEEPVIVPENES